MVLVNSWRKFVDNPAISAARIFSAEVSLGLLVSWLLLFVLELLRPGMVSLYFDLHIILAGGLISWLVGNKTKPNNISWYAAVAIFAIMVIILALRIP